MGRFASKNYLLIVLSAVLAFGYVDRAMFVLLQQDIKEALHLSDTQLGILNGIGFALFFALMGVPIARWVDRGNRVAVLGLTTGVATLAVALSGIAIGFTSLLLARIVTAIGESGCAPVANSLLPESYDRGERPRALGRYLLGAPAGSAIGALAGGWLNQAFGWRLTFLIVAVPGLVLAILAMTLREPRRDWAFHQGKTAEPGTMNTGASLKDVVLLLLTQPSLRHLWLCSVVWQFCAAGQGQWIATLFIRRFNLSTAEVGSWMAVIIALGGILGTWLGGELSMRFARHNERRQLQGVAAVLVLMGICYGITLIAPNHLAAFGGLCGVMLANCLAFAPTGATIQTLVPPSMRATATTLSGLLPIFIGLGLGPTVVGALSDGLRPIAGEEALHDALLALVPGYCWAAWYAWRAGRTVEDDLATINNGQRRSSMAATLVV